MAVIRCRSKTTFLGALVMAIVIFMLISFKEIRVENPFLARERRMLQEQTERAMYIVTYHKSAFDHLFIPIEATPKRRGGGPIIPQIVHQTWPNTSIPDVTRKWVEKWQQTNPRMQYWFWTDNAAHALIKTKYPQWLSLYDNFPQSIYRADAMRYFILYEFGGVYADLDLEPLKNLDLVLYRFPCVLSQEPEAHSLIKHPQFRNGFDKLPCNAFMACRPKHPFFKEILDYLLKSESNRRHAPLHKGVIYRTGPGMLARLYESHLMRQINRPDYEIEGGVFLAPAEIFIPTYDRYLRDDIIEICKESSLEYARRQACAKYHAINFRSLISERSLTVHHWFHSWLIERHRLLPVGHDTVDITIAVPHVYFPFPI